MSVSLAVRMLQVSIMVPEELKGVAEFKGLLGNYDNITDNDLIAADGTILNSDVTEEDLYYQFGQTCKFT